MGQESTYKSIKQIDNDYNKAISQIAGYTAVNIETGEIEGYELVEFYKDSTLILIVDKTIDTDREEKKTYYFKNGTINMIILLETTNDSSIKEFSANQQWTKIYYNSGKIFHIAKTFGDEDKVKYQSYFDNQLRAMKEYIEEKKTGNNR